MASEQLRNCPFCGGDAVDCFTKVPPADMSSNAWAEGYVVASIACGKCGARARQYSLDTGSRTPTDDDVKHALANAAISWSARVKPFTESEVNAAIAATVDELRARIQQLETYSRCDAETIEQLQARVAELEQALTIDGIEDLIKTRDELTADIRTAADQCEALSRDNQRLRELLRRVVDSASGDDFGSVGGELVAEIKKELGK